MDWRRQVEMAIGAAVGAGIGAVVGAATIAIIDLARKTF
tara:strand:+ start:423 stop:539 length:117 start_codon:yes stop_codon:yes gene_type:complete